MDNSIWHTQTPENRFMIGAHLIGLLINNLYGLAEKEVGLTLSNNC